MSGQTNTAKADNDSNKTLTSSAANESSNQTVNDAKQTNVANKREPKNWDKIVRDLEDEDKDEDKDEEKGVDSMFKELYAKADDDARRAMMKSYVESKGTTLSMNWSEVGSKFVKPYDERDDKRDSDDDEHELGPNWAPFAK